jgi:formate hydrogenlyase subunit 3/multisubunit Na+/H+ antiporter MnhD subunit
MPAGDEPGGSARRRSPLLAAVLSGLFPGLGQLYNRERLKALLFVIGGVVSLKLLLFVMGGVVTAAGPFSPFDVNIDLDNAAAVLRKLLLALLPLLVVGLWSVIDAYRTARRLTEG